MFLLFLPLLLPGREEREKITITNRQTQVEIRSSVSTFYLSQRRNGQMDPNVMEKVSKEDNGVITTSANLETRRLFLRIEQRDDGENTEVM